jgi:benzoyl-CoA reductase/2-hydroxyglutaryl-CoA dehydratase subunit BcrC/BadD/HgdB
MGVKEKIKTNIQRNLNQKYIKRLLGILAKSPVLYAYGRTSPSVSNKYLNTFSIKSLQNAYNGKQPVGFGSLFLPYEFLHGIAATPFLPEVMAGFTASLGLADQTLEKAASSWYSQDLCTFHRSASGAVEMDIFPRPSFIICSNLACDAAQKSFYHYSKIYGIEKQYYLLDVPYENNPEAVIYLAGQLKEMAENIIKNTDLRMDTDKFSETIKLSNEFRKWALKVNTLRRKLLDYPSYFNGLNFILPFHGLAGTEEAVILYKQMHAELTDLLKTQKRQFSERKSYPKRILWMHLKPYYKNDMFEIIEMSDCRVVFEEINNVYWPELDPGKPFESMARKVLSHPLSGKIDNRIKALKQMVLDFDIDGAVLFSHWGCRQSNAGARIIKDSLGKMGISVLVLDGDCVDRSNSSAGQIKTRLQGYMEILESK